MCKKIEEAAAGEGLELSTKAVPLAMMGDHVDWADVVLVAPQVRFMLERVRAGAQGKPVEAIDMAAYGMMNGKAVLAQVKGMM